MQKSLQDIIREKSIEKNVYKCDKCNIEKANKIKLLIHTDKWHTEYHRYGYYRRLRMVCNGGDGFDWECSLCLAHFNGDSLTVFFMALGAHSMVIVVSYGQVMVLSFKMSHGEAL